MTRPTVAVTVTDPQTLQTITLDRLRDPSNPTAAYARFTTVAVRFPRPLTDDEAEVAAGLFGYAWAQHGAGRVTGAVDANPVLWHDLNTMVVTARMDLRPERTRTRVQATRDLFTAFTASLETGSPVRKDGEQLVPPLRGVDPTRVHLFVSTT